MTADRSIYSSLPTFADETRGRNGSVGDVLLCGMLMLVPQLRDARLALAAGLARFGLLVGVEAEDVNFQSGDVSLSGTIVFPERFHPTASVVLVHGSGTTPRILWLARLFASEGFGRPHLRQSEASESPQDSSKGDPRQRARRISICWLRTPLQPRRCYAASTPSGNADRLYRLESGRLDHSDSCREATGGVVHGLLQWAGIHSQRGTPLQQRCGGRSDLLEDAFCGGCR